MHERRVVVTGMGVVSPVGIGCAAAWDALIAGQSGVGPITSFDASAFPVRIAAEIKDFDADAIFGKRRARHLDRFCQLALVSSAEAMSNAGLDDVAAAGYDPNRVGVVYATGIGGLGTTADGIATLTERGPEWVSPYMAPMMIPNMAAGEVAMAYGLRGYNSCTVTACAASAHAIGDACEVIRRGRADAMVAGGSEGGVLPIGIAAFAAMKALSTRNDEPEKASRPFDRDRDGFVAAEGSATLVLEEFEAARRRGAPILAELVGYGATCDAHHITAPHPEGDGAIRCMREALDDAALDAAAIGYVNAHGTSTPPNDRIETLAVKSVLGTDAVMSSTKSMTGHLLGAAGAFEAFVCVQSLRTGVLAPTINYDTPDPDCDLDCVPNEARTIDGGLEVAMTNSFGFGGHNATLILRKV